MYTSVFKTANIILFCLLVTILQSCGNAATKAAHSRAREKEIRATVQHIQDYDSLAAYITRYEQKEDLVALAITYNVLGYNLRKNSEFAEALIAHNKALEYSIMSADTMEIMRSLNNLGTAYRRMGQLKDASIQHYKALEYCGQYSDQSSDEAVKNRVVSLNGISNIHLSMGDMKVAEKMLRMALEGETQLGSDLGRAINFANLGAVYESYGQMDSAWLYHRLSMECNRKAGSQLGISLCHNNFGGLYETAQMYDSALMEYGRAYELIHDSKDSWHAFKPAMSMARLYLRQGNHAMAHKYLMKSLALAEESHSYSLLSEVYQMLAEYEELDGEYENAIKHYKMWHEYNDSLHSSENMQQMHDSYMGYEKAQYTKQIEDIRIAYEEEVKLSRTLQYLSITVLIFALVLIVMFIYVLRTRRSNIRMLKRMNNMRTTFFTNITHEFRTPLTVILGLAERLRKPGASQQTNEQYISSIQRQGNSLLNLVNQLLDIASLESGVDNHEWCKMDIIIAIRGIIDGYTDYARLRKIDLTFTAKEEQLEIGVVPDYLEKIIRNLFSNAFKYTPEGGKVTVSAVCENGFVVLDITDTGCGFNVMDLPHVFEQFYQGSNNKAEATGTGVGLPYVKQMVEYMNGTVEARNSIDGGAELVLRLPLRQPADIEARYSVCTKGRLGNKVANEPLQTEKREVPENNTERYRVLVVEDNADVILYMKSLLQDYYEVHTAGNGYEALMYAEKLRPDLIITDLMMPEMSGEELCQRLRDSELLCHIPIVVVTARGEDEVRIRVREKGADAYMQKPFNADEMLVRVKKLIEQRRMLQSRNSETQDIGTDEDNKLSADDRAFITRLNELIENNMGSATFNVEVLAGKMHLSSSRLYRRIKSITGYSTQSYILRMRMERAKELLETSVYSVSEVAMQCGFEDAAYFTRVFHSFYGFTPSQIRKKE